MGRYLNDINTRYGRPIWLTELACPNPNGTLARQLKYARGAFKVLDENDYVERWESCAKSCSRAASLCPMLPPAADTGGGREMSILRPPGDSARLTLSLQPWMYACCEGACVHSMTEVNALSVTVM